MFAVKQSKS